jgi:hypothetical protein
MSVVVHHMPSLGRLQHTLPEEGEAGPPTALTFPELQAVDVAFGDAIAPFQREPRGDRDHIILQSPREAGELVDAAVRGFGHPRLEVLAPALPHQGQKGLNQLVGPCYLRVYLAELLDRELRVLGPLHGGANQGERYRTRRWPLGACIRRALRLRGQPGFAGPSQRRDKAADGPGGVRIPERLNLAPELHAASPTRAPAADEIGDVGRQHMR